MLHHITHKHNTGGLLGVYVITITHLYVLPEKFSSKTELYSVKNTKVNRDDHKLRCGVFEPTTFIYPELNCFPNYVALANIIPAWTMFTGKVFMNQ